MSKMKLLSLSDFEWASAARYIMYISTVAGLAEINVNRVNSFPLGMLGPDKLLKQKRAVLAALEGNKSRVERFAGERRKSLGKEELSVLRTLYMQYKGSAEVVRQHIDVIETCLVEIEMGILQSQEVDSEDELF